VTTLLAPEEVVPPRDFDGSLSRNAAPVRGVRAQRLLAFVVPLVGYLIAAAFLSLRYHSYSGDAQSRLANAFYTLFGRDPHLAAIGFVWNPLTSLADMPLAILSPAVPALTHEYLAAGIVSALAMAGAGYQAYRFLEELGVRSAVRWTLLACFVCNPMIIYYGGNGMSEALLTFTLAATARYLARWLRQGEVRDLVLSGVFLGLAYLDRNEAVAAAVAATILVWFVSYFRTVDEKRVRRLAALTDSVIYVSPFLLAFGGWAVMSWVIVGHPFEQYSSAYGTASQLRLLGQSGGSASTKVAHFRYVVVAMWTMAPLLPVLLLLAGRRAWQNRDLSVLAVVAILGGVCSFEIAAYATGQISWAYRYVIYVIMFSVMLAACVAAPPTAGAGGRPMGSGPGWVLAAGRRTFDVRPQLAAVVAFVLLVPGVVTTAHTMLYSNIDRIDQADLPRGGLMLDNFEPCVPQLILQSNRPSQFSIPNDRDFKERLGAPYQFGVRYFLVPPPTGYGSVDALNVEYPSLWANGAGIANLVGEVHMADCPVFSLYKLLPITN
jgi:hypothetical protein